MKEGMLTANTDIESNNATDYDRTPKSKLIPVMWGRPHSNLNSKRIYNLPCNYTVQNISFMISVRNFYIMLHVSIHLDIIFLKTFK